MKIARIFIFLLIIILYGSLVTHQMSLPSADDLPRQIKIGQEVVHGNFDILQKTVGDLTRELTELRSEREANRETIKKMGAEIANQAKLLNEKSERIITLEEELVESQKDVLFCTRSVRLIANETDPQKKEVTKK